MYCLWKTWRLTRFGCKMTSATFTIRLCIQYSILPGYLCKHIVKHDIQSILFLFYPITLEGRRGTTDEFATIPVHLDLFSAALVELAKSIPVHSLILSSHLFFCLPLFMPQTSKKLRGHIGLGLSV